ncbi:MAG: YlxR family protein [Eubacteriales bacterium]|nr:YlxR family protein [Eubacteriales bacterium]
MAHEPERMCIGCRKKSTKKDLIRLVKGENEIILDKKGNALARGVYICKSKECILLARKKKALSRNFKQSVQDSVYDLLIKELENG